MAIVFYLTKEKKKMENGDWAEEGESANEDLATLSLLLPKLQFVRCVCNREVK